MKAILEKKKKVAYSLQKCPERPKRLKNISRAKKAFQLSMIWKAKWIGIQVEKKNKKHFFALKNIVGKISKIKTRTFC